MRIRNATIADLDAIIALNALVQKQHADALPESFKFLTQSEQTQEAFRGVLTDSTSLVLLAEDTEPAGYLWAQFLNRQTSWARFDQQLLLIQHMVVAQKFRRSGVGTRMLRRAVSLARRQGIKTVELDVWSFNAQAKLFYAKQGFETLSERMSLDLEQP